MYTVNIGKAGASLAVDFDSLSPASQKYLIQYGLNQALNDAHAGITAKVEPNPAKRAEQALAAAESRLQDLLDGTPPTVGARSQKDDIGTVALQIAREKVMAAAKAKKLAWRSIPKEKREAAVDAYFTKHKDALRAEAERRLEATQAEDVLAGIEL